MQWNKKKLKELIVVASFTCSINLTEFISVILTCLNHTNLTVISHSFIMALCLLFFFSCFFSPPRLPSLFSLPPAFSSSYSFFFLCIYFISCYFFLYLHSIYSNDFLFVWCFFMFQMMLFFVLFLFPVKKYIECRVVPKLMSPYSETSFYIPFIYVQSFQ